MTVHVSMTSDAAYAVPLAVSLRSIAGAHPAGGCEFTVIHDGIPEPQRRRIEGDLRGHSPVEWLPLTPHSVEGMINSSFLPPAALFRLLLPRLLDGRGRTVYVDCDVVGYDALDDLMDRDLAGLPAAAVRDAIVPFAAGPLGTDWRGLGLPASSDYFNSGVIVMDLNAFRDGALGERACDILRGRALRWGDQCALNAVLAGLWRELPRRWNVQTADLDGRSLAWVLAPDDVRAAVADPAIIHFSERDKPWLPDSAHPARTEWLRVVDETAYRGWRPAHGPRTSPAPWWRAVRRARRALRRYVA